MAVILVHQFTSNAGTTYDINYNTDTESVETTFSGGPQETDVTAAELGFNPDDIMYSLCEDTTYTKIRATLTFPFGYREADLNSPLCTVNPPSCDLTITSITKQPESQQGAGDGSVTVTATSSFTGIQYSIDGVNWQTGGQFNNLTPGNYIAYVRDSNSCEDQRPFTVDAYNNPVAGGMPIVEVSPGNISRWNAAFNPVVFRYQRRDYQIVSITQYQTTSIIVQINTLLNDAEYQTAKDQGIYFKSDKYEFLGKPVASYNPGIKDRFRINAIYVGDDSTGFLNAFGLRVNFKVITEITAGSSPLSKQVITCSHSPDQKGMTRANLSVYLKTLLKPVDLFQYDLINFRDVNLAASCTIRFKETWDGGEGVWYNAPYPFYVTYAALQLQEKYAGNMAEYIPFLNEPNPDKLAKWITDFEEPVQSVGLPFDISFIYSENVINEQLIAELIPLDINRQPIIGGILDSFLLNEDASFLLNEDASKFLIEEGTQVNGFVEIINQLGLNRLMLPSNYGSMVYYLKVQLYYVQEDASKKYVTQPIVVKIDRPCAGDPYVYLKWINHVGSWDYYRFGFNQTVRAATQNTSVVKRFVSDWSQDETINDVIRKESADSMVIGSDILATEVDALKWLRKSIKVQVLSNLSPYQWKTVIVQPGTFSVRETRSKGLEVSLTITLPEDNIQNQ